MGRYFGLSNLTKHHNVSYYWKNHPPPISELNHIAVIFAWDLENDDIECYSYADHYKYFNNEKEWIDQIQYYPLENVEPDNEIEPDNDIEPEKNTENKKNVTKDCESINVSYNPNHDISVKQNVDANISLYIKTFDSVFFGC